MIFVCSFHETIYRHNPIFSALFVFASPSCCAKIRTALKMNKAAGFWLDMSISDESMRRITILPEKIPDDTKNLMMQLYGSIVEEIDGQVRQSLNLSGCYSAGDKNQHTTMYYRGELNNRLSEVGIQIIHCSDAGYYYTGQVNTVGI